MCSFEPHILSYSPLCLNSMPYILLPDLIQTRLFYPLSLSPLLYVFFRLHRLDKVLPKILIFISVPQDQNRGCTFLETSVVELGVLYFFRFI